jgi:hypothetical protein
MWMERRQAWKCSNAESGTTVALGDHAHCEVRLGGADPQSAVPDGLEFCSDFAELRLRLALELPARCPYTYPTELYLRVVPPVVPARASSIV